MAEANKNTHKALHAIQYRDKDGAYEIAPGAEFAPAALGLDAADLEARGAVSKIKAKKVEPEKSADSKDGDKK